MEIGQVSSAFSAGALSPASGEDLSREDFLQLLVAQLRNQDPLSPMESQEFAADLAQFSSLEQLVGVNERLEESIGTDVVLAQAINNTLAATLLGQDVTTYGNDVSLESGKDATMSFALAQKSADVQILIRNESGAIVRTISQESMEAGKQSVEWDGKNDSGKLLPGGNYTFEVSAYDAEGESVPSQTYSTGRISGVRYENGQAVLIVNGKPIAFSNVLQVGASS